MTLYTKMDVGTDEDRELLILLDVLQRKVWDKQNNAIT